MKPEATSTKAGGSCKGARGGESDSQPLVQVGRSPALEATRRDVLSLMGFGLGAASLAACRAPVQNAIPLPVASDQLMPGVSTDYATTCGGCASGCGLVVKQRDGRPIKIEGNAESPLFGGGTCAAGQATVLSLYDDARLRGPTWQGKPAAWAEIDRQITSALQSTRGDARQVVLLSGTITSPSTRQIIETWGAAYPTFRHVSYDAVSLSGLRAAHQRDFGVAMIPHYRLDRARVVVGLDADFLGAWLSPVEFARQYAVRRTTDEQRSFHVQCEPGMSVTGSNADLRIPVAPSDLGMVAVALLGHVARRAGLHDLPERSSPVDEAMLASIAERLWNHRGESLVVSGSNEVAVQTVVSGLNALLGNIGKTVDVARPSLQRQGDDAALATLIDDMNRGAVHTLIIYGCNPGYDHAAGQPFLQGLKKVALSVSLSDRSDETGAHVHAVCPDHHFLESWGDAEPVAGHLGLAQPTIAPLFDTRAAAESLLRWAGVSDADHYTYLRTFWKRTVFPRQTEAATFDEFWDASLQRGVVEIPPPARTTPVAFSGDWRAAARSIVKAHAGAQAERGADRFELHLHESVGMRDGRHANNPWLQELPDPITKVTWGNVAALAPHAAAALGVQDGDVVSLKTDLAQLELPVLIQPGQEARTISVALGHGRTLVGKAGQGVGVNAFALTPMVAGTRRTSAAVAVAKTGRREALARSQTHFSMEGRPIVLETSLAELGEPADRASEADPPEALPNLWAERLQGDHSWGMAIDLDKCTGCSACVVACQAENNVPVVGKDQVQRSRIMHWIRIDRYYSGPEDNPTSVHQPMMCQHCGHAPCETVCPVVATTTSSEGINQQVYNRCIGTRYCANNCPYKVRRFNWYNYTQNDAFDFNMQSPLGRMVLNPDVTVRSRGVMEKCSLCVQRIQLGKNQALQRKEPLRDGDVHTACQQVCPTEAIVFGDLTDAGSRVSRLLRTQRSYQVLEELGTRPNVGYLKKVRG